MGSHRGQSSLTGEVLVQLVLQVDEGVISSLVEGDSSQDGSNDVRSDLENTGIQDELLDLFDWGETVARSGQFPLEHQEGSDQSFQAQQVISRDGNMTIWWNYFNFQQTCWLQFQSYKLPLPCLHHSLL